MKRLILLLLAALVPVAAQPMLQPSCTVQTLVGTYAISYAGWLTIEGLPAPVYGTILGTASIYSDGTITSTAALGGLGPVADWETTGTVEVNQDCVGKLHLLSKPKGSDQKPEAETDRFIFIEQANSAKMLVTIAELGPGVSPATLGTWERISRRPGVMSW